MNLKELLQRRHSFFLENKNSYRWLLFILIVLHAIIKFTTLPELELQGDEAFSVYHAQQTIPELLQTLNNEANPPLYYLFLHFWIKLFGIGLFAVKSLNILISLGTAFFLFKITKKVGDIWLTIFVSSCFLFSNLHFDFSHEIRAFQLVLLLTAASYYTLITFIETHNKKWLIALVLFNVALPYSHYNAVLVPLVQFFGCLLYWNVNRKIVYQLILSYVLSALLFLPQLFVFTGVIPDENFWLGLSKWEDFKYILGKVVGNDRGYYALIIPYLISPLILIFGLRYSWFLDKFSWRTFLLFWMLFLFPLLINFALAQYTPSFQVRYVLFTSLGLYLALGYLFLNLIKGKWIARIYLLGLTLHFVYQFVPAKRDGEGWSETAQMIESFKKRNVAVVISSSYKAKDLLYYYNRDAFHTYKTIDQFYKSNAIFPVSNVEDLSVLGDMKKYEKIILVLSHSEMQDPNQLIADKLAKQFTRCYELGDPIRAKIQVYNTGNTPCESFKKLAESKEKSDACWYWEITSLLEEISGAKVVNHSINITSCGPFKIDDQVAFSPSREEAVKNVSIVDCELEFECSESPSSLLVVSVEKNGETFKRAEYKLSETFLKGEKKISIKSSVLGSYPADTKVKVYVWNPGGPTLVIKKLSVGFWKK